VRSFLNIRAVRKLQNQTMVHPLPFRAAPKSDEGGIRGEAKGENSPEICFSRIESMSPLVSRIQAAHMLQNQTNVLLLPFIRGEGWDEGLLVDVRVHGVGCSFTLILFLEHPLGTRLSPPINQPSHNRDGTVAPPFQSSPG
jgi:hypothetical protein